MLDAEGEIGFAFGKTLSTILMLFMVSFALTMLFFSYQQKKQKTVRKNHLCSLQ